MTITEIRIELDERNPRGGLVGIAEVVFDGQFVVKEVKIIRDPANTDLFFLDFPSRPFVSPCSQCSKPNGLAANYCNRCGRELRAARERKEPTAHPITGEFRAYVTDAVLEAWQAKKG